MPNGCGRGSTIGHGTTVVSHDDAGAGRQLQAETARRDAGMPTKFLVPQAQRGLTTAETTELPARLDYRTALMDFERVQTAP